MNYTESILDGNHINPVRLKHLQVSILTKKEVKSEPVIASESDQDFHCPKLSTDVHKSLPGRSAPQITGIKGNRQRSIGQDFPKLRAPWFLTLTRRNLSPSATSPATHSLSTPIQSWLPDLVSKFCQRLHFGNRQTAPREFQARTE